MTLSNAVYTQTRTANISEPTFSRTPCAVLPIAKLLAAVHYADTDTRPHGEQLTAIMLLSTRASTCLIVSTWSHDTQKNTLRSASQAFLVIMHPAVLT